MIGHNGSTFVDIQVHSIKIYTHTDTRKERDILDIILICKKAIFFNTQPHIVVTQFVNDIKWNFMPSIGINWMLHVKCKLSIEKRRILIIYKLLYTLTFTYKVDLHSHKRKSNIRRK